MRGRLYQYALLIRLDKPIGILLLLWPTLWALWMSSHGHPQISILLIFVAGTILMRAAGCAINDFADREFDGHVARTRERPLAARRISATEALLIFCVLSLCAFSLVLFLNRLTILLALGGAAITVLYPFTKRYTWLPQLVLGAAFSWGVPMAFAAQTDQVTTGAWLLYAAAFLWPVAYDTLYAMADREDDIKIGIKSTAILFGRADCLWVGLLQTAVLILLGLAGSSEHLGLPYYTAVFIGALLVIYQLHLAKNRDPQCCLRAFRNNNWLGLIIFIGIVLSYW